MNLLEGRRHVGDEDNTNESGNRGRAPRSVSRRGFIKGAAVSAGVAATDLAFLPQLASAANSITVENTLAGTDAWDLVSLDDTIEGFATEYSVNAGQPISFKVRSNDSFRIEIYRLGWYQGLGGRRVATINSLPIQTQPSPITDTFTGLVDCRNWAISATWNVPTNAVSGVYFAVLRKLNDSTSPGNRIQFVIRNDGRQSDVLVQTSDTTYQAYNRWGGYSLYAGAANWGRAVKVSYNRPMDPGELENEFMYAEYPLVRWLERNGFDVAYTSCIDTDQRPAELLKHKVFISSGHDEYWSGAMRANVEAARDAGVNLIFMTGNECYWKVRWESDGAGSPHKTLVCYKETLANAKIDPSSEWTGTWRDPRFSPPSNGGSPENALTGTLFKAINALEETDFPMEVPYEYSRLRIWRNTSIANLDVGQKATLSSATLGYEWNTDGDFPARPNGLIRMSQTTQTANQVLQDYGSTYITAPLTHYLTMYKAPSGALVWSTGSNQWSWGLDTYHTNRPIFDVPIDVRMQQATLNVLADMGAQPASKQSTLVSATKSTDSIAPVSIITSPAAGSAVPIGSPVTILGTATDSGGGLVAGIEISTDDGVTWHPGTGTASWSYVFTPTTLGPISIKSRATDDSCNVEVPAVGLTITGTSRALPCSIWSADTVPVVPAFTDTTPLELGLRFRTSIDGFVTGVRFYKGVGNGGTHTGRLWGNSGSLLRTVTFTGETASGWQQAMFASPVAVTAGTTYVVSYSAPQGRYSGDPAYFNSSYELAPLRALANGTDGPNGIYGPVPGSFPTATYGSANYWVDVIFDTNDYRAPSITSTSPAIGVGSVATNSSVSATFSEKMTLGSIAIELRDALDAIVGGASNYNTVDQTITFTPATALSGSATYTATILAGSDNLGNPMDAPFTWSFTTAGAPGSTPTSIWTSANVPMTASATDWNAIELGVKFKSEVDGLVTGVRFYKGATNVGTHLGRLWSAAGALLANVTFSNESASGWQQADFATSINISAGQTYVVSYYTPTGGYSVDAGGLSSADVVRGPLRALAGSAVGGNGVFRYGSGGGFPNGSYGNANYWVDVMFTQPPDVSPPAVADYSPSNTLQGVAATIAPSVTFDKAINPSSLVFMLTTSGGAAVPGTVVVNPANLVAGFTPTATLNSGELYSASVTASSAIGTPMAAAHAWTFTVATPVGALPATIWDTSAVPATPATTDKAPVEVGLKFRADLDGAITAIRFYKGPGNTGIHVGHLWALNGTLLGSVSFANESGTGWQQANFASPVPISAGQTYIASYFAPVGRYSHTGGGLASAVDRAPLHAVASGANGGNGLYAYGNGAFPNGTYGSSNYWVDVVYVDNSAPAATNRFPAANATDVALSTVVSTTFSEAVQPSTIVFELRDGQGSLVAGSTTYDGNAFTATFTPGAALTSNSPYTASISGVKDLSGNTLVSAAIWNFSTINSSLVSLFGNAVPQTASANDPSALELGMKFRATQDGQVLGVRFFKGAANTGVHIGNLWTEAGVNVATVTFNSESASGWQYAAFSSPVPITANTTYVVSYYTPTGMYAVNGGFFNPGDFVAGPLVGLGNAGNNPNGLFRYGAGGGFPTGSYGGGNYWVDVIFQ